MSIVAARDGSGSAFRSILPLRVKGKESISTYAEGIMYSSRYYNGFASPGIYFVRFISCVALHALWTGSVGISVHRRQEMLHLRFPARRHELVDEAREARCIDEQICRQDDNGDDSEQYGQCSLTVIHRSRPGD